MNDKLGPPDTEFICVYCGEQGDAETVTPHVISPPVSGYEFTEPEPYHEKCAAKAALAMVQ